MASLFAFFAGINQYPNPKHVLRGCVRDLQEIHQYLLEYCEKSGVSYHPLVLTDQAATRQAIIEGFQHFEKAGPNDYCLFYFSGHGSRCKAPESFWGLEPDHHLESLVCWDSRTPNGRDLMDKEVSYLIWKASQGKNLPFVSIMDCCHSGDVRAMDQGEETTVIGNRTIRDVGETLAPDDFAGSEYYQKDRKGQMNPPYGRRVHLGAARNVEFAQEVIAGGHPRGIFTYCLIETLRHTGPEIAYSQLRDRIAARIANFVKYQSPQLSATFPVDSDLSFLFSQSATSSTPYIITWSKRDNAWILNAGAIHDIPRAGALSAKTILALQDADGRRVSVESVFPTYSTVNNTEGLDKNLAYSAIIVQTASPKLLVAFAPEMVADAQTAFNIAIQNKGSDSIQLTDDRSTAPFWIRTLQDSFFLTKAHDSKPLFASVFGFSEISALEFLLKLETVSAWKKLLDRFNPTSTLGNPVEITLFRLTEALSSEAMNNDSPMEIVDWKTGPVPFSYFQQNGREFQPAFQMKIQNISTKSLWLSVSYLGSDFSVNNALLPKCFLTPGGEAWVTDMVGNYAHKTIPLQIDDSQRPEVEEYLKIIISTEEFNSQLFNQKGVNLVSADTTRALGLRNQENMQDWATQTVSLRIIRN